MCVQVDLTGEEVGRSQWAVSRVAMYHNVKVAAKCIYSQVILESNKKVHTEIHTWIAPIDWFTIHNRALNSRPGRQNNFGNDS